LSGKLRIEHFGNDEFINDEKLHETSSNENISYRKDYFLRVFRKWKQDVTEHGCEFRLLLSYFSSYKAHFEERLKLGFKQSICGSKREDPKE